MTASAEGNHNRSAARPSSAIERRAAPSSARMNSNRGLRRKGRHDEQPAHGCRCRHRRPPSREPSCRNIQPLHTRARPCCPPRGDTPPARPPASAGRLSATPGRKKTDQFSQNRQERFKPQAAYDRTINNRPAGRAGCFGVPYQDKDHGMTTDRRTMIFLLRRRGSRRLAEGNALQQPTEKTHTLRTALVGPPERVAFLCVGALPPIALRLQAAASLAEHPRLSQSPPLSEATAAGEDAIRRQGVERSAYFGLAAGGVLAPPSAFGAGVVGSGLGASAGS